MPHVGTVQEHVLAKQIRFQYGRNIISGELVLEAKDSFHSHLISSSCCRQQLERAYNSIFYKNLTECLNLIERLDYTRKAKTGRDILFWISLFASREVTDARDKVYGVLGLAIGDDVGIVEPDYTDSFEEVFYALAIGYIQRKENLDIFSYLVGKRSSRLPSFVPDWLSQPDFTNYNSRVEFLHGFSASGDAIAKFDEVATGKLSLRGIRVDTILDHCYLDKDFFDKARLLCKVGESPKNLYQQTGEERDVALWLTLCGGMQVNFGPATTHLSYRRLRYLQDYSAF